MILIIDNYDSFTYNLVQLIETLGYSTTVWQNDNCSIQDIELLNPEKIILSPGPKTPLEAGISLEVITQFQGKLPILGVCLGHQAIALAHGSKLIPSKELFHGTTTPIVTTQSVLYQGVPKALRVAQYNSLAIDGIAKDFTITAKNDLGDIMSFEHNSWPLFGVQYHPESFMTEHGDMIVKNFLSL